MFPTLEIPVFYTGQYIYSFPGRNNIHGIHKKDVSTLRRKVLTMLGSGPKKQVKILMHHEDIH